MVRIAVVTSHPPLSQGGHLVIAQALNRALREAGHEAAVLYTPEARFGRQASAYWRTWRSDVRKAHGGLPVDQVISLRFPSYAIRHARHVSWLNHRMREYYDLWDAFQPHLSWKNRLKEGLRRRAVHGIDTFLLRHNVERVFAQSKTIQTRLSRWGGIPSEVVYPPPPPRPYRCDAYGDYLFVISCLTPLKRIGLVVDALAHPDAAGVRCVIAGDGEDAVPLRARIARHGLDDRVHLVGRLEDRAVVDHFAGCRAVCFPPLREDYGFVTAEAFASRKAIVTCVDSGGPAELVQSGVSGLIAEPTAPALAAAIRTVMSDAALAERYGAAGHAVAAAMTWAETVERLVVV